MSVVSWKTGVAGNWSNAADWSTGSQPGWTDSVVIAAAGAYTVTIADPAAAQSLTIFGSGASVVDSASLSLTGLLAVNAGGFTLAAGGVFHGGTLAVGAGGTFAATGGTIGATFDTTTIAGTLALSGTTTDLGIVGNVRLTGAGGSGAASLAVTADALLAFDDVATVSNATIALGAGSAFAATLQFTNATGYGNETVTLGSNLVLNASGSGVIALQAHGTLGESLINKGTINEIVAGATLLVQQGTNGTGAFAFVNRGHIAVGTNDVLAVTVGVFANPGTIAVDAGTLAIGIYWRGSTPAVFTSLGNLSLSNGAALALGSSVDVTTADLQAINVTNGATLFVAGSIDNEGATLSLGPGSAIQKLFQIGGSISDGIVSDPSGAMRVWGGFLSNIIYEGTLTIGGSYDGNTPAPWLQSSAVISLGSGLQLTGANGSGPGTLTVETGGFISWTAGPSPVNAAITIGPWKSYVQLQSDGTSNPSLVLGPESVFNLKGAVTIDANALPMFINHGLMTLEPLAMDANYKTYLKGQALVNLGIIDISRPKDLSLADMEFSSASNLGSISCNSAMLNLSNLTNSNLLQAKWGGVVTVGTLTNVSGGVLTGGSYEVDVFGAQGSLTSINLSNVPSITTDAANITLSGANSAFTLAGTVALDSTLTTIAAGGALTLSNGRTLTATAAGGKFVDGGTLTLADGQFSAKSLSITTGGTLAATGYADSVTGPVINAGHVLVNTTTMQFIGGVSNKGSMTVTNGALSLSGPLSGSGHVDIGASGSLILSGSVAAPQTVDFLPGAGLLELAKPAQFAGTIAGFAAGDKIDLLKTAADGETYAAGALRLTKGGAAVATLTFAGSYTAANFTLASDGHRGTLIAFHK